MDASASAHGAVGAFLQGIVRETPPLVGQPKGCTSYGLVRLTKREDSGVRLGTSRDLHKSHCKVLASVISQMHKHTFGGGMNLECMTRFPLCTALNWRFSMCWLESEYKRSKVSLLQPAFLRGLLL
jgi:hypothetical protein